ncbi:MAG: tetratricopeptide repeat protein [Myxococcales bacterium]|jgi:tetratricopeptide (TPR) repeat protein
MRSREAWALGVALFAAAAIYGSNLGHEFQFDDRRKIVEALPMQSVGQLLEGFGGGYSEHASRLIPNLSFLANHALGGLEPTGYHLLNLALHLLNVLLVWRFAAALFRRVGRDDAGIPVLAAAIFALHPLNSEAVSYCNARPNLFVTTFFLGALLALLTALRTPREQMGRRVLSWIGFALLTVLALLSKELGVTIVAAIPLVVLWLHDDDAAARPSRSLTRWLTLAAAASAVAVTFATGAHQAVYRSVVEKGSQLTGSWWSYLLVSLLGQSEVFVRYLGLTLLPLPAWLNVDHRPRGHLHEHMFRDGQLLPGALAEALLPAVCALALVGVLWAAWRHRRRAPVVTFAVLWLFVTHAPTSVVPRGEPMVEYRTYLPMVGACVLLAAGLLALWRQLAGVRVRPFSGAAAGLSAALLGALALGTGVRVETWKTEQSLWLDSLSKLPENARAHDSLGRAAAEAGDRATAVAHFHAAIEIDPDHAESHNNLGVLLAQHRDYPAAAEHLLQAAKLRDDPNAYNNLGNVLAATGELQRAVVAYEQALALSARFPEAQANLGLALVKQGRVQEGIERYRAALELTPDNARIHVMLGDALLRVGELQAALSTLQRAVRLAPDVARAHALLGRAYGYLHDRDRSLHHLRRAGQLDPTDTTTTAYLQTLRE